MIDKGRYESAMEPAYPSRFFVERANAGDVEGLVALYENEAVLALPTGEVARGAEAIRAAYTRLQATRPTFAAGKPSPVLVNDDLALTSTRTPTGATVKVARRQHDGSWLWLIDQPNVTP